MAFLYYTCLQRNVYYCVQRFSQFCHSGSERIQGQYEKQTRRCSMLIVRCQLNELTIIVTDMLQ